MGAESYCREIEAYLCRKNDGHLIRVVGPAFEMVSRWEADGVPLKIAFSGIDRALDRYQRKGPRRRPLRIEFCEADVLDTFDEWRRAVGVSRAAADSRAEAPVEDSPRRTSVPGHLERALLKLTSARVAGRLGVEADDLIDRVARELDDVKKGGRAVRGEARAALAERLNILDADLLAMAARTLDEDTRLALERDAQEQLRPFRQRMPDAAYTRALAAAVERLVRDRLDLPTLGLG